MGQVPSGAWAATSSRAAPRQGHPARYLPKRWVSGPSRPCPSRPLQSNCALSSWSWGTQGSASRMAGGAAQQGAVPAAAGAGRRGPPSSWDAQGPNAAAHPSLGATRSLRLVLFSTGREVGRQGVKHTKSRQGPLHRCSSRRPSAERALRASRYPTLGWVDIQAPPEPTLSALRMAEPPAPFPWLSPLLGGAPATCTCRREGLPATG